MRAGATSNAKGTSLVVDVDWHQARSHPYIGMASRDNIASLNKNFHLIKLAAACYAQKEFVMP